jgi:cytochrome c2
MRRGLVVALVGVAALLVSGCSSKLPYGEQRVEASGRSTPELMIQYGCPTCHVIPGVPGAVGKVGPSLDGLGQRSYLAGRLANNPEQLQRWLMHPQSIEPGTAMPEMGVSRQDARQMAEYLERKY